MCIVKMAKAFLAFLCPKLTEGTSKEGGDTHCDDSARSKKTRFNISKEIFSIKTVSIFLQRK